MDQKIANSMAGYIEQLYEINKYTLFLCGADVCSNQIYKHEKIILNIIDGIPRLVPYVYDNKINCLRLEEKNGLLEYNDKISYLESDYQDILKDNEKVLDNIRILRNKYQHKMHAIKCVSSGSGSHCLFDISFKVNDTEITTITIGQVIKLNKQLNILFEKIIKDIMQYAYDNGKTNYAYYDRLSNVGFCNFNKLYESDILREIGKSMQES